MMTIEKKSLKKSGRYVDTKHVNTVIRNYKQTRWSHNSERIGKEDSMSLYYTLDELEEYIEKIRKHGGDGIRIYFAAYPHDFENEFYADRQTVVLVATKSKETESGITHKDLYIGTEKGTTILAYNYSDMCPPFNCPRTGGLGDDPGVGTTLIDRNEEGMIVV